MFADTGLCPSCFSPLTSAQCGVCGLDLASPRASEVLSAGLELLTTERRRQAIIARMRETQAEMPVATPHEIPVPARPAPPAVPVTPIAPVASAPSAAPRRSSVQVFLLTLGVVLVSVAAAFFLFIAYVIASVEVRAVMTALASVLVFGAAWLLRARRLRGTAEGIAAIAIVLLLLDVWLVRANALFGSGDVDASIFTGMSLVILSLLFLTVSQVTGLRVTAIAWAALSPLGVFLLVGGVLARESTATAWWAALGAAGVLTLAAPLVRTRRVEYGILRVCGFVATTLAMPFAAAALPDAAWTRSITFLLLGVLWAAQLGTHRASHRAWSRIAAIGIGLSLVLAAVVPVLIVAQPGTATWLPATCAGGVGVVLTLGARLSAPAAVRRVALDALWPVTAVTVLALLPALTLGATVFVTLLAGEPERWSRAPLAARSFPRAAVQLGLGWGIVLAPLFAAILLAVALWLLGRLARLLAVCVGLLAVAALGAASLSNAAVASVVLACVVAAAIGGLTVRRPRLSLSTRLVFAAAGTVAVPALCATAFSSAAVWPYGMAAAAVLTVIARALVARMLTGAGTRWVGAVLSGCATAIGVLVLLPLPEWLVRSGLASSVGTSAGAFCTAIGSAAGLATIALVTPRILPRTDAGAVGIVAALAAAGTTLWIFVDAHSGDAADTHTALLVSLGLIVVVSLLWQVLPRGTGWPQRVAFAAAAPAALALFAGELAHDVLTSAMAAAVLLPLAAVAAAAVGVALVPAARQPRARLAWDASTVLVATAVLVLVVQHGGDLVWLSLILLALVPLLLTAGHGDVFTGTTPWRHAAWSALPLAVAALWSYLVRHGYGSPEPYSLPVAGVLATLALLVCWRRPPAVFGVGGRNALAGAATVLAVLPSVLSSGADAVLRPLVSVALGAVLLLTASLLPAAWRGLRLPVLTVVTGTVAALGAGAIHATALVPKTGAAGFELEAWTLPGIVAAAIAAVMWTVRGRNPRWLGETLVLAAVAAFAVPEAASVLAGEHAQLRLLVTLALLGAAHIGAVVLARPPLGRAAEWTTLGALVVIAVAAAGAGEANPVELATVPIAIALGAAGFVRLDERSSARSWPQLAPACAVLLMPSLLSDFGEPPLWRVVALGVVCVMIVVAAVLQRLQAPLLIAGVALIAHAIAQLWPWISAAYTAVPWWLWLGIGGVILIVLAATYEKRLRDVRAVVLSFSSLR